MGLERPVDKLHQRMDNRLRMDDDIDVVVGDAKQIVRLDNLKALVEQGRGVDCDSLPHRPRRVRQRIGWRDVLEFTLACAQRTGPPMR